MPLPEGQFIGHAEISFETPNEPFQVVIVVYDQDLNKVSRRITTFTSPSFEDQLQLIRETGGLTYWITKDTPYGDPKLLYRVTMTSMRFSLEPQELMDLLKA